MNPEEASKLRELAEKLIGLSQKEGEGLILADDGASSSDSYLVSKDPTGYSEASLRHFARNELERSRQRKRHLPVEVSSTGAWNIMLDLFENEHADRRVSIKSACIAAGSSPTTGLRYINLLFDMGYVKRLPDLKDNRRVFLCLTDKAKNLLREVLGKMIDAEELLEEWQANQL